jgi:hypothetical protein
VSTVATGYVVTSVVSLLLSALAWRAPRFGRFPFAALFLGAAIFNTVTASRTPNVYVEGFAQHALPPMREFIERVLSLAPGAFVISIAIGQFVAGVGLVLGRGLLFRLGVVWAASFLVGISWLGVGAAFPTNLVMAAGVLFVLRGGAQGRRAVP